MLSKVPEPGPDGDGIPFVRRLGASETYICQVAADQPQWIVWHWNPNIKRNILCEAVRDVDGSVLNENACEGCIPENPMDERRKGYLYVYASKQQRYEWLELTRTAWHILKSRGPDLVDWFGMKLQIQRGAGKKAHFTSLSVSPPSDGHFLKRKDPPDLEQALRKLVR